MLCSKDQKGPVTALEDVDGYLLSCIGQKVNIIMTNNKVWLLHYSTDLHVELERQQRYHRSGFH